MNDEKTALVPEVRKLKLGFSEPLTEAVVKALIDGPKEEGHEAALYDDYGKQRSFWKMVFAM